MSESGNKYKKYFMIIVPILLIAVIVELILLLKPNNELKSNQVKPNYDEELRLADIILFDSANVSYDNTSSGLTSTNVQDAIEEIYTAANTCTTNLGTCQSDLAAAQAQIPQTCSNSPFHLGDYISMTPTITSFTPDRTLTGLVDYDTFKGNAAGTTTVSGTLNPSELSVWRVIRINSDCTVEVVSEYVSSVNVRFASKVGYQNLVYYLNEIAKQYANTTYTLNPTTAPDGAFRNVGYDGQTKQITNTTRLDDTTLGASGGAWYMKDNYEENLGGGDSAFGTDMKLLSDASVPMRAVKPNTTSYTTYWLTSRHFDWGGTSYWYFSARYVDSSGNSNGTIGISSLWNWSKSSFYAYSYSYAVRPIVTLKSNITHSSGSGTSSSHYQLSVS